MAQEDTKQEQVNPADELKKAAEAAEQAQGSELPPELGIEPEGAEASLEDQLAAATAKAAENFDLYVRGCRNGKRASPCCRRRFQGAEVQHREVCQEPASGDGFA